MKKHLSDFELRLQTFLHEVAEDMALEVEREQQHLLLMQNQVALQLPLNSVYALILTTCVGFMAHMMVATKVQELANAEDAQPTQERLTRILMCL